MHRALEGISGIMLDLDGVVWVGRTPVKGAPEAVRRLREMGKKIVFMTNNSARSRKEYIWMLRKIGIRAKENEIVTSGRATAVYLSRLRREVRAYVIGERGLKRELVQAGIKVLSDEDAGNATHLVVGKDSTINYRRIWSGLRALMGGAEFVATNTDATYPTENGLAPGAGAMIGAMTGCSGRTPDIVIGKPYSHMLKIGLEIMGTTARETAIIGDRAETDVMAGKLAGMRTILVLSGVTKKNDLKRVKKDMRPDYVFDSLAEVVS
ncbi:MAG: HAD-IIA family hydrolase [Candidatus Hadarchaeales archaeon]